MHVTCVKRTEIAPEAFLRCDVLFQHYRKELEQHILGNSQVPDEESVRAAADGTQGRLGKDTGVGSLVSGAASRPHAGRSGDRLL